MSRPNERPELDHAAATADHIVALLAVQDPNYRATPELHDALAVLVRQVVSALLVGRRS